MRVSYHKILHTAAAAGIIFVIYFIFYGAQKHLFTSEEALREFLNSRGIWAPFIFLLFQAAQVIIPVLPGNIGCLGGVLIFGPAAGFAFNYIGICLGSLGAFLLAKKYGQSIVKAVAKPSLYEKYSKWLEKESKFEKWFALAIFLPVTPDDFLCYLAGLTSIKTKKFIQIILFGKPWGILLYSYGLAYLFEKVKTFL